MKILIASDIHGSAYWCEQLLFLLEREKADRMLLLGDILYHGPRNDLPRDYAPKAVTAMLNGLDIPVLCVRGNCDAEIDQTVLTFPLMSDYALLLWGSHTLFVSHGHVFAPDNHPRLLPGDAFLSGHIHIPVCERRNGILYLNPGSVSLPKEGTGNTCMMFENGLFRWFDLKSGEYRKEENWEAYNVF